MSRVPGIRRNGRALLLLPSIPDDAPDRLKDALAIRNACTAEGVCPVCGATAEYEADGEHPWVGHVTWRHENGCPALVDEEIG